MRRLLKWGAACGVVFLAAPALAHPHVFIDAGVEVVFDTEGRAEALRITWIYDDLYSLLVVGERGLDDDFDGVLTPAEQSQLSGFDMNWDADFPGDAYALIGGVPLSLSPPQDWTAEFAGGQITSTHRRDFDQPVLITADPLIVQVYDPSFYTSYRISRPSVLTNAPTGCDQQIFVPDREAADAALQAALEEYSGTEGLESDFPAIGAAYAEEARITCAKPF